MRETVDTIWARVLAHAAIGRGVIRAVERAGLNGLNEGQKVSYDVQEERGKLAAVNLKA